MSEPHASLVLTWSLAGGGSVRIDGHDLTLVDLDEVFAVVGLLLVPEDDPAKTIGQYDEWVKVPVERAPQVAEQFATADAAAPADVAATIARYEQCSCGRFAGAIDTASFPHDDDETIHTVEECVATDTHAEEIADAAVDRGTPTGQPKYDYAEVADIATEARNAGRSTTSALIDRYLCTPTTAAWLVKRAREKGYDIPDGRAGRKIGDAGHRPKVKPILEHRPGDPPVTPTAPTAGGFPPHDYPDLDEDAPVVDDPPLSTHPPLCDCIRCATRRGREARDATAAAAAHAEATKIEWGHNGKLGRQKVAGDT